LAAFLHRDDRGRRPGLLRRGASRHEREESHDEGDADGASSSEGEQSAAIIQPQRTDTAATYSGGAIPGTRVAQRTGVPMRVTIDRIRKITSRPATATSTTSIGKRARGGRPTSIGSAIALMYSARRSCSSIAT